MIALDPANAVSAMNALGTLGFRPRAPVTASQFADEETRRGWIRDKGLTVFWSPSHPATEVDIFVEEPFPFDEAFARATHADLGAAQITVVGFEDLIALKRAAGRPKDEEDIRALLALSEVPRD